MLLSFSARAAVEKLLEVFAFAGDSAKSATRMAERTRELVG
jgi:hypothetical protein